MIKFIKNLFKKKPKIVYDKCCVCEQPAYVAYNILGSRFFICNDDYCSKRLQRELEWMVYEIDFTSGMRQHD